MADSGRTKMQVGFIGLGNMGAGMAGSLLKAGHEVTVWNRSPDKAAALVEAGATLAARPADAGQGEVVMTMLADDRAVEAVVWGEGGIAGAPALHVGHSTIGLPLARRLAETGNYVSAPVFGRPDAAAAAKLFVMAAGPAALVERAVPLLDAIGQRIFRLGDEAPAANLVKLCGNYLIMGVTEALAEAMALAEKGGVAPHALLEVLTGSIFGAPVVQNYGRMLAEGRFTPAGFAAPLGLKDLHLVGDAAAALRVPMPVLAVAQGQLLAAMAQHGEEIDWAGVGLAVRAAAGLR